MVSFYVVACLFVCLRVLVDVCVGFVLATLLIVGWLASGFLVGCFCVACFAGLRVRFGLPLYCLFCLIAYSYVWVCRFA